MKAPEIICLILSITIMFLGMAIYDSRNIVQSVNDALRQSHEDFERIDKENDNFRSHLKYICEVYKNDTSCKWFNEEFNN